jgi:hypothetical protein
MTATTIDHHTDHRQCEQNLTRTYLAYGVAAGPMFVLTSVIQGLTRQGFDFSRHEWSLLSNGSHGWIQVTNFVLTGLMTVLFALGVRRAVPTNVWRLVAVYGVGLVGAGIFKADPMTGFPLGTPSGPPETVTWHGWMHLVCAGIGFSCLIVAMFKLARTSGHAVSSRIAAGVFIAGFAAVGSGSHAPAVTLAFVAAVVLAWVWVSATAISLYARTNEK